jgi:hypothetical protein
VTVIRASAAGARSAAKTPCSALAPNSSVAVHRQPAQQAREREAQQPDDERALASHEVRDPPAEQQEPTERQRVRGHDPLHVLWLDAEIGLRARDREVHDRGIEHDHQLRDGDDEQRLEALRI